MAKHRQTETKRVNPLFGGAMLAGAMLVAAPAGIAFADTMGINGRPNTPNPQPGVNAIQSAGDKVFNGTNTIPGFLGGGPISLDTTGAGSLYHAEFGTSTASAIGQSGDSTATGSQGLTVGVVNSFTTNYKLKCNIVVQVGCGSF